MDLPVSFASADSSKPDTVVSSVVLHVMIFSSTAFPVFGTAYHLPGAAGFCGFVFRRNL